MYNGLHTLGRSWAGSSEIWKITPQSYGRRQLLLAVKYQPPKPARIREAVVFEEEGGRIEV